MSPCDIARQTRQGDGWKEWKTGRERKERKKEIYLLTRGYLNSLKEVTLNKICIYDQREKVTSQNRSSGRHCAKQSDHINSNGINQNTALLGKITC